jgi:peptide/nickel transport system substrate-binding protein
MQTLPKLFAAALLAFALAATGAGASDFKTLRIGLADDPDMLDPTMARTYTGRIVFAALCDKLVDITPELDIAPRTASRSTPPRSSSASSATSTCPARTARPRSAR